MSTSLESIIGRLVHYRILEPTDSRTVYRCIPCGINVMKNGLMEHLRLSSHMLRSISTINNNNADSEYEFSEQFLHNVSDLSISLIVDEQEDEDSTEDDMDDFVQRAPTRLYPYLDPVSEYTCCICSSKRTEAVKCSNGHQICPTCHEKWLLKKRTGITCTQCRVEMEITKFDHATLLMHDIQYLRAEKESLLEDLRAIQASEKRLVEHYNHLMYGSRR